MMKKLSLTTLTGIDLIIYINSNITFYRTPSGIVKVLDGLHNNGGWEVKESLEYIERKLDEPLSL